MITHIHFLEMEESDLSQSDKDLPKGMTLPESPEVEQAILPNLQQTNYVAMIYKALQELPVVLRVNQCVVCESDGQLPEVRLVLNVVGVKEMEQHAPRISHP